MARKTLPAASCHCESHGARIAPDHAPIIALVGTPNAGKSTLFNGLTGAKARMGNWPGTTVEVSRGAWHAGENVYDVIDFPGAYSLDPMSPDEELTRDLIIDCAASERPDLVMVAVDAASLGRSLYMVAQLAEEEFRLVVVVTKADVAAAHGMHVDGEQLSRALGVPVVVVDPRRRSGLSLVADTVAAQMQQPPTVRRERAAGDEFAVANDRFAWVERALAAATTREDTETATWTERIDKVALHPVAGPLLFLATMWVVFQITTTVAAPLQDGLESLFSGPVSDWVTSALGVLHLDHPLVTGLVVDGLIGGVGMVLTFAPLMALMFLCLAVLEDSGYMARAAVVTDRLMKRIGLPGKAFIPLIVGFGCNVPAISATRVLAKPSQRLLTALLIPFTSCSARLTVYVMLAATFFPHSAGTVVFLMYVISIALVVLAGLLMRHTLWRRVGDEPLVIDLPVYQLPGARLALSVMWLRLKGFLQTAGGIIVATVAVVFLLQSTPAVGGYSFGDEDLPPQDSVYGTVASTVAPVFTPAGFGSWSITGTLLTGFVAKEAVIASWAQTYALEDVTDDTPDEQASSPLATAIRADFDEASGGHPLAAVWAFMIFLLSYTPCVATLAAQRREIGLKWTLAGVGIQLVLAWVLAVACFHLLSIWL
ncbi:ferrous iron transport protein B [Corynebacterium sp. 13CS0277]|uniref:ferrous iron transport protein B n=1 Tax=Corynebacterium sp. 13CS0277 TaxID=2071994 RepID=UPI000D03B55E|nr:ferrous iron transport protein B [Corynebacterium sp. 13CS0277]PRQ12446.1 ferrous iron transport protein B [Corynebacterium sp. 13CS0277]